MAGKTRHILLLFSFCLMCLYAVPLMAGAPNIASQAGSSFKMRVDVDLVTVEVYALDGKGNPVRHLKKEDFRLYEDGKRQEILSFDEVDGSLNIPASAMPILDGGDMPHGKTVLIIFDESTIPESRVQKIRDSAARFVREHMQPQDLFAVASWIGTMRIVQNLTDDRAAVLAAIAQPTTSHGWGMFERLLQSLEQINYSIASIKGKKAALIYGRPSAWYGFDLSDAYSKALISARKSNVIYYMVDPGPIASSSLEIPDPITVASDSQPKRILPPEYTLKALASASGGYSIADADAIDTELDKLSRQIGSYYILGFQSGNQKHEGAFRKVRVTSSKDLNLKYQPGYQDRRPIDVLASNKQEQMLLTALATPGAAVQLPLVFRPSYFYDSSRPARVLIAAKIWTEKMAFKKKGGAQLGVDLSIMGTAYAENGSIAARFSEILPISFEREKEAELRKQGLAYRNYFRLRPGKYRLKLAVSDESNNLGTMEQFLEVPALPDQGFACSSLVVAEQLTKLPDLIPRLQTQLLEHSDPLLYRGVQAQPSVENRLPVNAAVSVLFRAYNLSGRSEEWDLVASPRLLGERGEQFVLPPIHLKEVMSPAGPAEAAIGLRLPFQSVPPGKYRLAIEVKETGSGKTATLQTDLELIPNS